MVFWRTALSRSALRHEHSSYRVATTLADRVHCFAITCFGAFAASRHTCSISRGLAETARVAGRRVVRRTFGPSVDTWRWTARTGRGSLQRADQDLGTRRLVLDLNATATRLVTDRSTEISDVDSGRPHHVYAANRGSSILRQAAEKQKKMARLERPSWPRRRADPIARPRSRDGRFGLFVHIEAQTGLTSDVVDGRRARRCDRSYQAREGQAVSPGRRVAALCSTNRGARGLRAALSRTLDAAAGVAGWRSSRAGALTAARSISSRQAAIPVGRYVIVAEGGPKPGIPHRLFKVGGGWPTTTRPADCRAFCWRPTRRARGGYSRRPQLPSR